MNLAGLSRWSAWLLLSLACLALLARTAGAAGGELTSVEPASVKQGDTVMLTIHGKAIPQGSLVVEFFPEQIAVLSILAADASSVSVQVRVPKLAPPGPYNVLVYNQLGQEAFGQAILTVETDLVTPVFRDYDPKAIGEATSGFALILTGDSISAEVVPHLTMTWELNGNEVRALKSSFSYGGPGMIVCAVAGKPPGGVLRGRVELAGVPIYLVELTIKAGQAMIVGHAPSQVAAGLASYTIRLLGAGFSSEYVSSLSVKLINGGTTVQPLTILLVDNSSVGLEFPGPLPSGQYQLTVLSGAELAYDGLVEITPAEAAVPATPDPSGTPPPDAPAGVDGPSGAPVQAWIIAVTPLLIEGGSKPNAFFASGKHLTPEIVERLVLSLKVADQECPLQFVGAASSGFTCVFNPPGAVWPPGANGTLAIADPERELEPYSIAVFVSDAAPDAAPPAEPASAPESEEPAPADAVPAPPAPPASAEPVTPVTTQPASAPAVEPAGEWLAQSAWVETGGDGQRLVVSVVPPQPNLDPEGLTATFSLLPANTELVRYFSGFTTTGALTVNGELDGALTAACHGQFLTGDLLVSLAYGAAPPQVSVLSLDAPPPAIKLLPPASLGLRLSADGLRLEPDELRWELDCSPLAPQSTAFLLPVFFPRPQDAGEACSLELHGSQLTVVLHPPAWDTAALPVEGITFSLDSALQLDWSVEPSFVLPLEEAHILEAPTVLSHDQAGSGTAVFSPTVALIDAGGIELSLTVAGLDGAAVDFSPVEATTTYLLLSRNLDKFQPEVQAQAVGDGWQLKVNLVRDRAALPDEVYQLLVDDLVAQASVQLGLSWPAGGLTAAADLVFQPRPEESAGAMLDELGLGET